MQSLLRKGFRKIFLFFLFFSCFWILGNTFVFAQDPTYSPLIYFPGIGDGGVTSIPQLINTLYQVVIGIGALFGVIKIAYAGVKYSMSDVVTNKESAKKDIKGVLLGLGILLIPFIVLNTIYPGLTNLDFISRIPSPELQNAPQSNLTPLQEGQARISCTVGTVKKPDLIDWFIKSPVYLLLKDDTIFTDELCTEMLECSERGWNNATNQKAPGVLVLENNTTYTCTYQKKTEEDEVECEVTQESAASLGKTREEICAERCANYKGQMDADFTCTYNKYVD